MTLSQNINELQELLGEIRRKNFIKLISYPLILVYVGIPILKWINKKIEECNNRKKQIDINLNSLVKKVENEVESEIRIVREEDTYLIYHKLHNILTTLENFNSSLLFLQNNNTLFDNQFNERVSQIINTTQDSAIFIESFNENFVKRRKESYRNLWKKSSFTLDDEQLTAVIKDDKYNLIVAGAGSGKTEVLITRIAYLIKRSPDTIKPNKILALAFQRKAAEEIRERLKQRFSVDVNVKTFHAFGKEILETFSQQTGKKISKLKFSGGNSEKEFNAFVKNLFNITTEVAEFQNDIINYMKLYADDQIIKEETDFTIKEDYYKYIRELRYTALDGTKVKSKAEREILNFFITHTLNGDKVKILYECPAEWMQYETEKGERVPSPDFFFPDFNMYLEHWALNKDGKVPEWFTGFNSTKDYQKSMKLKKQKFSANRKYKLIETYSWEYNDINFLILLEKRFTKKFKEQYPDIEVKLEKIGYKELVNQVWEECKESTKTLPKNVSKFIAIAKTYSLTPEIIAKRLKEEQWTPKQLAFAKIALRIYQLYEQELRKENVIDFADMINLAVKELRENDELYKNEYEHILIDEYQDISTQRYELIKALMDKCADCKLFCVGDDWQSIMSFAGANSDFFVHFDKYFDHPARTDLSINYRSIKSIVDTGALVIKYNGDAQLQKKTIASNPNIKKVKVYTLLHQSEYRKNYFKQMANHCVQQVGKYLKNGYKPEDLMILARIVNNPTIRDPLFEFAKQYKIPIAGEGNKKNTVPFMSVHRSKGLQAKVVFILNVDKDIYGFPCELENPDIFDTAIMGKRQDKEAEERRLFYVALTRAKEEVYIYNQKCTESIFLKEIKNMVEKEEIQYFEKGAGQKSVMSPERGRSLPFWFK
ncbi:MAG: UvrD-helicase domain-containing protein [Candidatus Omnitrophica bacterium]|nr:UvrD-helicase domain-containing protein [Candidatus Omnitrophota bacterium]